MSRFAGMTGNEVLHEAGVLDAWDEALRARDRGRMIACLKLAEFDDATAAETVDFILKTPELYTFDPSRQRI